jgi:hypothetical protein
MTDTLIIRSNLQENFAVLPNEMINDENLTSDALAVLVYLLSKPNDWQVRPTNLRNRFGWGKDKVYRILANLEQLGYMRRESSRNDGQFAETRYFVMDSPCPDFPDTVLPDTENKDTYKEQIKQKTDITKSNKLQRQKKQLLVDWVPDTEDKVYATDRGLDWQEVLEDIRIWNEQGGNKAAYASVKAFWQGWVRRDAKRRPRASNRQQSACESKKVATLTPKQEEYAKNAAYKLAVQYKDEFFRYDDILKAVNAFMLTDQSDESWKAIGLGLPKPF